MDNMYSIAAVWVGLALIASLVSVRLGVSVALLEIAMGVLGGNLLGLQTNAWIDFLAGFGAVLLTFLAGAEIDPPAFRRHFRASVVIGIIAFVIRRVVPSWSRDSAGALQTGDRRPGPLDDVESRSCMPS